MDKLFVPKDGVKFLDESFSLEQMCEIVEWLGIDIESRVLDPFAGSGIASIYLALNGIETTAIEVNEQNYKQMIENFSLISKESRTVPEAKFGDSEYISLEGYYDAIITSPPFTLSVSSNPLQDLGQYEAYINKLGRIFARLSVNLSFSNQVFIEMGDDIFNGSTIPLKDMLKEKLLGIGYEILDERKNFNSMVGSSYLLFTFHKVEY